MAIAREGISHKWGANIGKMILEGGSDFGRTKQAYAAAGSDARMSGCSLPVMINSGSGNQGITLSVPLFLKRTIWELIMKILSDHLSSRT